MEGTPSQCTLRQAVYDGYALTGIGHTLRLHPPQQRTRATLIRFCLLNHIDVLWLAPLPNNHFGPELDDPAFWAPASDGAWHVAPSHGVGSALRVSEGERPRLTLIDARNAWWSFEATSADGLAAAIDRLQRGLGIVLRYSPGWSVLHALRATLRQRGWLDPAPVLPVPVRTLYAQPLNWRNHNIIPDCYQYVYAVDRTAAYLSGMRACQFGLGAPVHVGPCQLAPRDVGIYKVALTAPVPAPLAGRSPLGGQPTAWLDTYAVLCLDDLGMPYRIDDAWVWPTHHRLLRPLGDALWTLRDGQAGTGTVKAMYTTLLGRFRLTLPAGETPAWWYRPEWHARIVGHARYTLERTLRRLDEEGHAVLAVATDEIWFASDSDTLPADVPHEGRCGHYRLIRRWEGDEARALLTLAADKSVGLGEWTRRCRG